MAKQQTVRYVAWGHWGIDFREREGDAWGNPGRQVAHLAFPLGTRGPVDLPRQPLLELCRAWTEKAQLPQQAIALAAA